MYVDALLEDDEDVLVVVLDELDEPEVCSTWLGKMMEDFQSIDFHKFIY